MPASRAARCADVLTLARYRLRLRDVVKRKEKGKTIEAPEPEEEEPAPATDLMAALKASLAELKS